MEIFQIFFYAHKTIFEIFFWLVYFLEQLTIVFLIHLFPQSAALISSLFAILIISTISFEKICMESRYNKLNSEINVYQENIREISTEYNRFKDDMLGHMADIENETK